jgi:hypothetical protein
MKIYLENGSRNVTSNISKLYPVVTPHICSEGVIPCTHVGYFTANLEANYCTAILLFNCFFAVLDGNSTPADATPPPRTSKDNLLLGLSVLSTYTPPDGTRVQTDSGHSKVRISPLKVSSFPYFSLPVPSFISLFIS